MTFFSFMWLIHRAIKVENRLKKEKTTSKFMPCKSAFVYCDQLHFWGEKKKFLTLLTCKKIHITHKTIMTISKLDEERSARLLFLKGPQSFYSTVGSDAMHHYKPGTAIGSTGGRGSARNQRERLRALPCGSARPALGAKRTSQLIICAWTRPTKVVSAKKGRKLLLFFRLTFSESSELKALD